MIAFLDNFDIVVYEEDDKSQQALKITLKDRVLTIKSDYWRSGKLSSQEKAIFQLELMFDW